MSNNRFLAAVWSQGVPPDLDEMWRDFNKKLSYFWNALIGRKKRQQFPGVGGPHASAFLPLVILVVVLLVLWCLTGFYVVESNEQAIILRFGKFEAIAQPGLRWHFPYPIEAHEVYNVTGVRTVEVGYSAERSSKLNESIMLTTDENIVNISFSVLYTIKSIQDLAFKNAGKESSLVRQAAETAIREVVGRSLMDYVLYEGREEIAVATQQLMQKIIDRYGMGIEIVKVNLQNAQPPEQVQDAFNDAVKAVQDRERQKNEGQAYANSVIPKAQGMSSRLIQGAQGYEQRVINVAQGDAKRFERVLSVYQKYPLVTKERFYLETMEEVLTHVNKVLLDVKKNNPVLFLPLGTLLHSLATPQDATATEKKEDAVEDKTGPSVSQNSKTTTALPRFHSLDRLVVSRGREGGL